jgi:hypothetical protein
MASLLQGPSANKIVFETSNGIWEHLDLYTRTDLVKPLLQCTTQDMNSVRALWHNFVLVNPEWSVSLSTFRQSTQDFCNNEGVKGIKSVSPDHNVSTHTSKPTSLSQRQYADGWGGLSAEKCFSLGEGNTNSCQC